MSSPNPAQQKHLGRSVSTFSQELWAQHRYEINFKGNLAKFSAPPLLQQLVDTGDKFLAEASPYDLVWGIGFRSDDARALQPLPWPGLNLLGDNLMKICHSGLGNRSIFYPYSSFVDSTF
ncbi:MAG: NADAR family protein, partial [Paracoccaceae bacterium]